MQTPKIFAASATIILLVIGCGRSDQNQEMFREDSAPGAPALEEPAFAAADATGNNGTTDPKTALSSSAARISGDSSRRFIRTGDLRFRTDDVVKTSFAIEDLIARHGGYVANTQLTTQVNTRYTTPISADSLLETTKFTVINQITVRVPSAELDTTLKSLIAFVDFLDHRTLSATDVRLKLLGDRLTRTRIAKHEKRLTDAIDEQGKKLKETVSAEERLVDRQEQADNAALNTLELEDRIAYSTLTLDIYQRQDIRREMLPNEQNIEAYEPGFFSKAGEALEDGWEVLVQFVLFLIRSWSMLLLVALSFLLYRRFVRQVK